MDTYIGIDFGGTKLLIGEVDKEGNILSQKRYTTGLNNQQKATDRLLECVKHYKAAVGFRGNVKAAGVGIVGVVDPKKGIWCSMDYREMGMIPLSKQVSEILKVPVVVDNDVKSAVMGELYFGQGKKSKDFIYINIGTGISAGIVVNGTILRGANNNAGEVGHIVTNIDSEVECICGRKGCVECIASGSGLHKQTQYYREKYNTRLPKSKENERIRAQEIFELADQGDEMCQIITRQMIREISSLIMNLVRVTDPDTVILGGGVVGDGWLLSKIRKELNHATMRGVSNGVILSELDSGLVGLIGAAAHAMEEID